MTDSAKLLTTSVDQALVKALSDYTNQEITDQTLISSLNLKEADNQNLAKRLTEDLGDRFHNFKVYNVDKLDETIGCVVNRAVECYFLYH